MIAITMFVIEFSILAEFVHLSFLSFWLLWGLCTLLMDKKIIENTEKKLFCYYNL